LLPLRLEREVREEREDPATEAESEGMAPRPCPSGRPRGGAGVPRKLCALPSLAAQAARLAATAAAL
jgi:hypothetical protein